MQTLKKTAAVFILSCLLLIPLIQTTNSYTFVGFESTLLESISFTHATQGTIIPIAMTPDGLVLSPTEAHWDALGMTVDIKGEYETTDGTELEVLAISPGTDIPPTHVYLDLLNDPNGTWPIESKHMGNETEIYILVKGWAANGLNYQEWHRLIIQQSAAEPEPDPDPDPDPDPQPQPDPDPLEPDPYEEYDYPSEADFIHLNPTNNLLNYQFRFPWYKILKPAKQEVMLNGRLGLGKWVTDDLAPKYRLMDGDDFDTGLAIPPSWGGGKPDAYCTSGKRKIKNKEVNTFEFDMGFEKEIKVALLVMFLDEDGSGKYELVNKYKSSEIILWKWVAPPKAGAAGRWAMKIPSRKLHDMSKNISVLQNHIYGRAVLINFSGPNPPPIPPGLLGDNPQIVADDLNDEALLLAQEAMEDYNSEYDEYADLPFPVGNDPNMFGAGMEGEAETYCFVPYDEEARDFPSEPDRDVPNDGQANEYYPQDLPLIYNHMFFLGHEEDKTELLKEGKKDPPYVTPEITPKKGTRVEAKRVQKVGDDRDGLERRGYVLESEKPGEIMLKVGAENELEIDITVKSSSDKYLNILLDQNADGKYEGIDEDTTSEWVLQNMDIDLTDTYKVLIPVRSDASAPNGTYMRVMLTSEEVNPTLPWDGDADGFNASSPPQGEAETYYVIFGDPATDTVTEDKDFEDIVLNFVDMIDDADIKFDPMIIIPETVDDIKNLSLSDEAEQLGCLQENTPYSFSDISDMPEEEHLKKAGDIGLFEGYNGLFDPTKPIQRDEFAKVVAYSFCIPMVNKDDITTPSFEDVPKDQWSFEVVESLNKAGIMVGYEGKFRPADPINQVEYFTVLARLAETDQIQDQAMREEIASYFPDLTDDSWMINGLIFATLSELINLEYYMDYSYNVTRKETAVGIIGHLMPIIGVLE